MAAAMSENSPPLEGVNVPALLARDFALRPLLPRDFLLVFELATRPSIAKTWRFCGAQLGFREFMVMTGGGPFEAVVVPRPDPEKVVGYVTLDGYNPAFQIAYLSMFIDDEYQVRTRAFAEALFLTLLHAFEEVQLRKVYIETTDLALTGLDRLIDRWDCAFEEGRLHRNALIDGEFHDTRILSVTRDAFLADAGRMALLLKAGTRGE
jgi:RimJ/RimL family protein N-acetyltransferase